MLPHNSAFHLWGRCQAKTFFGLKHHVGTESCVSSETKPGLMGMSRGCKAAPCSLSTTRRKGNSTLCLLTGLCRHLEKGHSTQIKKRGSWMSSEREQKSFLLTAAVEALFEETESNKSLLFQNAEGLLHHHHHHQAIMRPALCFHLFLCC